jgi:hypothetical protein
MPPRIILAMRMIAALLLDRYNDRLTRSGHCVSAVESCAIHTTSLHKLLDAHVVNNVSSSLKYSPTSACLNVTTPVGSSFRASAVDRALTPKP